MLTGLRRLLPRWPVLVILIGVCIAAGGVATPAHHCANTHCPGLVDHPAGAPLLHGPADDALVASALLVVAFTLLLLPFNGRTTRIRRSRERWRPPPVMLCGPGLLRGVRATVALQRFQN